MTTITLDPSTTFVAAVLTYFLGRLLTRSIPALQKLRIPEAVTGGLVVASLVVLLRPLAAVELRFSPSDLPMLTVFAAIGLHARFSDLRKGGRLLVAALAVAVVTLILQNVIGASLAGLMGLPPGLGLMAGSVALIGGHGTAAAWGPAFSQVSPAATSIGLAAATFGLVAGGLVGAPLGKALIERNRLTPTETGDEPGMGDNQETRGAGIAVPDVFASLLVLSVAIVLGAQVNATLKLLGLTLPLFLTTLFCGILIGNLGPLAAPKLNWPMHRPALVLIADIALSLFLARALMALDLTLLSQAALPLLVLLLVQVAAVMAIAWYVMFPALGRNYDAAISSSGFVGLALGATPTALANMSSLTHTYGPSAKSFVVMPLVGAFFIDLVNAFVITAGLRLFVP